MAFPSWLPLGLGIRAYYTSGERTLIRVHTVDGEITPYPAELFFREYEDFGIFDEIGCAEARGHVLDIGAGAGCISLFLQELGLEVTAIDVAEMAIEVAKDLGVADARAIDFFDLKGEQFDTLLLMMNGIGFVGNLAGLDRFFAHAKTLLAPGGQILFDSSDLKFADIGTADLRKDKEHYYGQVWYQLEYKGVKGAPYYWLYLDPTTMRDRAKKAGFTFEMVREAAEGYYLGRLTLKAH
ncbi:MAG TPA: class I SAM-dependent methyltransferase [Bacteroidetes bacterium]|nr:class I SAM-dependent methyltransferase [Bacteroidota bacterium]